MQSETSEGVEYDARGRECNSQAVGMSRGSHPCLLAWPGRDLLGSCALRLPMDSFVGGTDGQNGRTILRRRRLEVYVPNSGSDILGHWARSA